MRVICILPTILAISLSLRARLSQPDGRLEEGSFRIGTGARSSLHALWQSSSDARAEQVACIGGYQHEGITYINRVVQVTTSFADSLHAPAAASLRECRPPEWLGTVHTHIARIDGQPYVTFSAADRGVMAQWRRIWRADGVFCVLYDERRAYCEAKDQNGDTFYGYARGNNIVE
jgi:hypothetical protein